MGPLEPRSGCMSSAQREKLEERKLSERRKSVRESSDAKLDKVRDEAIAALPNYLRSGLVDLKNEIELAVDGMIPMTRERKAHLEANLKIIYQRLESHFYTSKYFRVLFSSIIKKFMTTFYLI